MRIAGISGSSRAALVNIALLKEIPQRTLPSVEEEMVLLGSLPLFKPDVEAQLPASVAGFRMKIAGAEALIIVSRGYAHGAIGVFKNALDWLFGDACFAGKPVLALNTAPRAHHVIAALREMFAPWQRNLSTESRLCVPEEGISNKQGNPKDRLYEHRRS